MQHTPSSIHPAPDDRPVAIVEDDFLIRLCLNDYLDAVGYNVVQAADYDEIMKALDIDGRTPRILITDLCLDGATDGYALATLLRSKWPDLPVIFTSGTLQSTFRQEGLDIHMAKPYTMQDIVRAIKATEGLAEQ